MAQMLPFCLLQNQNSPEGLEGVERRFVMFGGGLGQEQLAWLERQLEVSLGTPP